MTSRDPQPSTTPDHEPEGQVDEPAAGAPSAWQRLRRLAAPRLTRGTVVTTVLALLLGFAVATQVRQTQDSGLESLRQEDLVSLLGNADSESARLQREAQELTRTRDQLRSGNGGEAARQAARQRLSTLGILAGSTAATGPGVEITLSDPRRGTTAPHLLDTVQELRDAGAEAIQINGVRVVASTWIGTDAHNDLVVDGRTIKAPYRLLAIGDPHTMSTAMDIPGGVVETLRQAGVTAAVVERKVVRVTALRRV